MTWTTLAAAKTIHEKETKGANGSKVYGYVMRAAQATQPSPTSCRSSGPSAARCLTLTESQRSIVRRIAALEFMLELGKYSPPGYPSFNADEVGAHLLQGTAAMSINWPAWISSFSDPSKSKVIGKMEFTTCRVRRNRPGRDW